jgi:hypothetical protein
MPFFRWDTGENGRKQGQSFGANYLYRLWKKACKNLGIEDVDLYGGTRHSTMQYLRKQLCPEGVKRLSLHTTNKALDRYLEISVQRKSTFSWTTFRPASSYLETLLSIR